MNLWQKAVIVIWGSYSFLSFLIGLYQTKSKKNPFGLCYLFNLIGAFVWADAVIFGIFFLSASLLSLFFNDWLLFLLIISLFWLIRSLGEMIYWLNQQFSKKDKNPLQSLRLSNIFPGQSIWFVYQIIWQCLAVVFIILSIYLTKVWWNK